MIFIKTKISGVYLIELEKKEDERGFFARDWCQNEYREHGLMPTISQSNIAFSKSKGTVRGLHYQKKPFEENKTIRCIKGEIHVVVIDICPDSNTYLLWQSFSISFNSFNALYVPAGCAHGYQTLNDDCCVFYQNSGFYSPSFEAGIRYDDPMFRFEWPLDVTSISFKDQSWPDFIL